MTNIPVKIRKLMEKRCARTSTTAQKKMRVVALAAEPAWTKLTTIHANVLVCKYIGMWVPGEALGAIGGSERTWSVTLL